MISVTESCSVPCPHLLGERGVVHVEDLEAELVPLLLQSEAGVVTTRSPGAHSDVRLSSAQLGESLNEIVQCCRLERDLDQSEGFTLTHAVWDVIRGVKLGQNLEEILG